MGRLKLKWKIFAFLLGFCALLLFTLWLFQTVFLTDMYKYIREREIKNAISLVGQNINSPELQDIFRELELDKEIIVMPALEFVVPGRFTESRAIPYPDARGSRFNRGRPGFETITQTHEFALHDGNTISLTFFAMVTPVDATVATLRTQLYIITAIMVLSAIMIAVVISKRISKPIEEINKSAKTLASGNYETHFNGKGFLEIKELSDTLNAAAGELSKVENLRKELMANVSHDLRTPLALIYSYAEMMHDFPDEITVKQTQVIMDETKRLTSLVNDILDITQIEANGWLRKAHYCLTESIAKTISQTAELIKKDGYVIDFEYDGNVFINADEIKITQAFYNLLINAINYCGEDKRVIVKQSIANSHVRISVMDNGEGISEENMPYVWDRYYKVDKKHKRPVTGTGIGLSVVKSIIETHGGISGAKSIVSKGSVFWFEIETVKTPK